MPLRRCRYRHRSRRRILRRVQAMTPDELRRRQALILYGANAYAFEHILSIAEDIRRTAYQKGYEDRTQALAMAWSFNESEWLQ